MSDTIPIRLSHLLGYGSVGAIIRGPEYLVTVKDIREWTDRRGQVAGRPIPYVDQVRAALAIDQELREPPVARRLPNDAIDGVCIPSLRFPSWARCPKCGLLYYKPWRGKKDGEKPRCKGEQCTGNPALRQIAWVFAHPHGHLADVPWHWLTHRDARSPQQKQCRSDWKTAYLVLRETKVGARHLQCMRCGVKNSFRHNEFLTFSNYRRQPWIRSSADAPTKTDEKNINPPGAILEINDARVHSPAGKSALVIPPESRIRKGTVTDRLYRSSQKQQRIDEARTDLARKGIFKSIATEFRCLPKEVEAAWLDIQKGYPLYGASMTPGLLMENEYKAFLDELPDVFDDEDFIARHRTAQWTSLMENQPNASKIRAMAKTVSRLIAVSRLKVIHVFEGFIRNVAQDGEATLVPPDIVGQSDWLPAVELFGEGIFFTLNEKALRRWETHINVVKRSHTLKLRYEASGLYVKTRNTEHNIQATPRFILMHTLSHIFIRQLEAQAGYPAASLKERIYCSVGENEMAGILIYVAVPDVAGSLGGLAEMAEPRRFLKLLSSVFDHSEWCSLDPICAEHEGQGPQMLNRAACHGCALVPEPACPYDNSLLDRVCIKGDRRENIPPFLDYVELKAKGCHGRT